MWKRLFAGLCCVQLSKNKIKIMLETITPYPREITFKLIKEILFLFAEVKYGICWNT
jgi:hypothetical protein